MRQQTFFVLLSILMLAGCMRREEDADSTESANVKVPVTVATILSGTASVTIRCVGKTDALRKEKVYSPIAGIVTTLHIQEGTSVHAGDIIAVVRSKEAQATIAGAEALLQSATTDQQKQEAKQMLDLANRSDNVAVLKARFDGYVAQRVVSENEVVAENAEMATLVDLSTVVVVGQVPMQDIGSVKIGQKAFIEFSSIAGRKFDATVDAISPQAVVESQTVPVRLRFDGDDKLRINNSIRTEMTSSVAIVTGRRSAALFVPKRSLIRNDENGTYSVFTMTGDSVARKIDVEVGVQSDSLIEIRSNQLKSGMPVIVEGSYGLADSTHVEVR